MKAGGVLLRQAPRLTIALMAGPVLAGLAGSLIPALQPVDGHATGFGALASWPGLASSMRLSMVTGLGATLIAMVLTALIVAGLQGTRLFRILVRGLSPLLSVPHAAAALGLAFLVAPSGWLARIVSPWATGWDQPPDLLVLNDPWGLALIAGLVLKEVPFLLLMVLAALPQADAERRMLLAASLGYGRVTGWMKAVLPAIYPQVRMPIFAVLAYAMTTVDMALILGPTRPPTLSAQVLVWMTQADLAHRGLGSAAALAQFALVAVVLAGWMLAERVLQGPLARWWSGGRRGAATDAAWIGLAGLGAGLTLLTMGLGLAGLALWSFAGLWQFPDALPQSLTLRTWMTAGPALAETSLTTATLAILSALVALAFVLACLEAEARFGLKPSSRALWLLYLPLIIPQVAFLPGLQVLSLVIGIEGTTFAVAAIHLVFVLPYVFLSLADPYRSWDGRIALAGATLGASENRIFWRLRLPMLLAPVMTALAVGFAVSVGQYLATLMIGGGRVETLTTEAVALSSGGNRRLIGAYALLQMALPALGFALALALPALAFRNRRGLRAAA